MEEDWRLIDSTREAARARRDRRVMGSWVVVCLAVNLLPQIFYREFGKEKTVKDLG